MYYSSTIDNPEEGLDTILEAATKFNADRFLYALKYKSWDEKQLVRLGDEVAFYRQKLEAEYNHLVEFAKVFNKEFATMNNQCYNSALIMLRKLRSGISETKKLFNKFCPRARRENIYHAIGNHPVSAFDYAYISADSYQLPLFKFEGYPDCVSRLHNEMAEFFLVLKRCMQLCKQVLEEERVIKSDNKFCKLLYDEFKDKVMSEIVDIIMMIPRDSEYLSEKNCPAIASRNRYDNDEAWAPVGFHNYPKTEVKKLVIKQVLDEEESNDLTTLEKLLFGNNEQKVHKYRYIITHFDELIPESYHRKNLPAKFIQAFFQFIGIPYKLESSAVDYFNGQYLSAPDHRFTTVTYQAVNGYKKKVLEDKDGSCKAFTDNLKQHFYNTVPLPKAANF